MHSYTTSFTGPGRRV